MKHLSTFILLLSSCIVSAQDTTFYNEDWDTIQSINQCSYYKILERNSVDSNTASIKTFFKSGQIKEEINYSNYTKKKKHGNEKHWQENGQLRKEINYKSGEFHGRLTTFWPNGILKRKEEYIDGKFLTGNCYSSTGNDTTFYNYEIMPEFPGGIESMMEFINENIKYPKKSRRKGIEGRVVVSFIVNSYGEITNTKILKGVNSEIDEEALRVVNLFPIWKPGRQDGENVSVQFNLPFLFQLR